MCAGRLTFNTTSSRADASTHCVASSRPSQLASQVAKVIPDVDHVTRRYSAWKPHLLLVASYDDNDDDLPALPRHSAPQRLPTPRRRSNLSTLLDAQTPRCRLGLIIADKLGVLELLSACVSSNVPHTHAPKRSVEEQPVFYQSYDGSQWDPVVVHPRHLSMLVKPKPWINYNEGGYLHSRCPARHQGYIEFMYAGLDVLGTTPGRINHRIFDVVLEVWNSGKRLGKMPPAVYDEPEPETPPDSDTDLLQRNIYLPRLHSYNQSKVPNHSDRCSFNYKIEISRSFFNDMFYLPCNVDFRGRAYPIPSHLNHIKDDPPCGPLIFSEKKPLGERGLRWLKIHLSNLYGYDKANFDGRVEFTDTHMEDIYNSALNPLTLQGVTGRGWWQKVDDLWQCLTTCMEVYSVIESGNPHEYDCALPVPQDGTCNGLQHYVALSGNHQGAKQVNLSASDRLSDVYTFVGGMVAKILKEEAACGERFAKLLVGKVSRKVVKQTVMTTVYGMTFIGALDQIKKHLKDRKDLPEEECWLAAAYLAKKVLAAIGDLFSGAKDIQTWLNLCARISDPGSPAEVNSLKQSSVFPPNFIHSLDATHMMLTAIETHACSIGKMSEIIRHTSIALYSSDVLKKLHAKEIQIVVGPRHCANTLAEAIKKRNESWIFLSNNFI
ncbi:hypothetical protein DFH09DRAFT_1318861 [Mycena vulgaris]|nr:hypothetical protein DFH09DRAFT_1318861 [Mycena vulgaris]